MAWLTNLDQHFDRLMTIGWAFFVLGVLIRTSNDMRATREMTEELLNRARNRTSG
ncbi:MAG TPA: hypothetical protein VGV09_20275 [Steroidobacteraceae bacterium]|nr:hypothetical protein [Steroidobacteraceae bacterium]